MGNIKRLLLLHFNILLFSFTGILSKLTAQNIQKNGILHIITFVLIFAMFLNCAIYAFFWQKNLKHFKINVAYAHRSVYNVWSLLWSVLFFSETVTIGNMIGTAMIISGILVIQSE